MIYHRQKLEVRKDQQIDRTPQELFHVDLLTISICRWQHKQGFLYWIDLLFPSTSICWICYIPLPLIDCKRFYNHLMINVSLVKQNNQSEECVNERKWSTVPNFSLSSKVKMLTDWKPTQLIRYLAIGIHNTESKSLYTDGAVKAFSCAAYIYIYTGGRFRLEQVMSSDVRRRKIYSLHCSLERALPYASNVSNYIDILRFSRVKDKRFYFSFFFTPTKQTRDMCWHSSINGTPVFTAGNETRSQFGLWSCSRFF